MKLKYYIAIFLKQTYLSDEEKYEKIANNTFHMAQRTTAGCFMNFYSKIHDIDFKQETLKCRRDGSKCE